MPLLITCPCSNRMSVDVAWRGKAVKCPVCGRAVAVPPPTSPMLPTAATAISSPQQTGVPILGPTMGVAAIVVGLPFSGVGTLVLFASGGNPMLFLIYGGFAGMLWVSSGRILMRRRERFLRGFFVCIMIQCIAGGLLVGSLSEAHDEEGFILTIIGYAMVVAGIVFGLAIDVVRRRHRKMTVASQQILTV